MSKPVSNDRSQLKTEINHNKFNQNSSKSSVINSPNNFDLAFEQATKLGSIDRIRDNEYIKESNIREYNKDSNLILNINTLNETDLKTNSKNYAQNSSFVSNASKKTNLDDMDKLDRELSLIHI